jgi:hypothetical protein
MKRFRLYQPGDLSVAVMPRAGLRGQARLYPVFGYGSAPSPSAKRN